MLPTVELILANHIQSLQTGVHNLLGWKISVTSDGGCEIAVSISCPQACYYRRTGDTLQITNNPKLLAKSSDSWEEITLLTSLELGCPLPGGTPWRGVDRAASGYITTILSTGQASQKPLPITAKRLPSANVELAARIETELMDGTLNSLIGHRRPVILFSGGVDSSFLAARMRAMGRDDTILLHYSFSKDDPETDIAKRIAEQLQLDMHIIQHENSDVNYLPLQQAGLLYYQPFCDQSTVPTYRLAQNVIQQTRKTDVILSGVGLTVALECFARQHHGIRSIKPLDTSVAQRK